MTKKQQIKVINLATGQSKSKEFEFDLSKSTGNSFKSISRVINWQLSGKRAGSANVKDMSEISGTTKKPFKQKGTGGARQGSKRSVQFVGGRTCHGPKARSFSHSLPKKIVKNSYRTIIKSKFSDNKILLSEDISKVEISSSKLYKLLKENNINSALIIASQKSEAKLFASASNLKKIKALDSSALNAYDLLKYEFLIMDENFLKNNI